MKKTWIILSLFAVVLLASCMGTGQNAMAVGGELTGVGGFAVSEPAPYGMVLIERGSLKVGSEEADTLWGICFFIMSEPGLERAAPVRTTYTSIKQHKRAIESFLTFFGALFASFLRSVR